MKGKIVPIEWPPSADGVSTTSVVAVANGTASTRDHDHAKSNLPHQNNQDSSQVVAEARGEEKFSNETINSGIDTNPVNMSDGKAIDAVELLPLGGYNNENAKSSTSSTNDKILLLSPKAQDDPSSNVAAAVADERHDNNTRTIVQPPSKTDDPHDKKKLHSNEVSTFAAQDPPAVAVQQDTPAVDQPPQETVSVEAAALRDENRSLVLSKPSQQEQQQQQQQKEGRSTRKNSGSTITLFDVESTVNGEQSDEEVSIDERFKGGILSRRGTCRIRKGATLGGAGDSMVGSREKDYKSHPVGSASAEFLERQAQRQEALTSMQEEVKRKLKLVMEHDPATTGSLLPDIDNVFPLQNSSLDGDLLL